MNNQKNPYQRKLESMFGYVATMAPAWNDGQHDLRYAIDPDARMSMRVIKDYVGGRYNERSHAFALQNAWFDTIERAEISLHIIDESVTVPSEESVRDALKHLITYTIAGDWYVAGFVVREKDRLKILLGYIHDHMKLEEPCKLYATATVYQPTKELHLRFADTRVPGRFFRDVHMAEAPKVPGSHKRGNVRVREFRYAKEGLGYDAEDLTFKKLRRCGYALATYYSNVDYPSTIDFCEL